MADKVEYHKMKDEALLGYVEKYDLDKDDYTTEKGTLNRKKLCNILKMIDIQAGKIAETMVVTDNEVKEHNPTEKLAKGLSGIMCEITFYNGDENDLPYVQMALNGIALVVPRENKCWIPKEFVDGVLQNAIATKMKMDVDRDGKIRYIPKNVPRVPYHVHDIKHIDQVRKEWDAKNKK